MQKLLQIMEQLRDPQKGCPWDLEQNFHSITKHTLEEAYEVVDAVESGDMESLKKELGDLLFQVVFYAQMAKEEKLFDFEDVAAFMGEKLIVRHPHIFGNRTDIKTASDQSAAWEAQKAEERKAKAAGEGKAASVLDDVAKSLPALTRASKLQKRAARVGFNWDRIEQVFEKLEEEVLELKAEIRQQEEDKGGIQGEIGDILFVISNIANYFDVDPEEALRQTNKKFERRFNYIEEQLANQQRKPEQATLEEMDSLWNEAKKLERVAE
jgi:ATP diphosphatase